MAVAGWLLLLAFCVGPAAWGQTRTTVGPADFEPVLAPAPGEERVHVKEFSLDSQPVTNAEFLAFVRAHPQWRRDRVPSLFAEPDYLSHWAAPDDLQGGDQGKQPVSRVSWFAARAYCAAAGGRLPDWYEWELAAAGHPDIRQSALWEWVEDFGSLMVSGDSRDQGDPDKLQFCGAGALSAQNRENYPILMRIAFLSSLEARATARSLGFRCATAASAPAVGPTTIPPATAPPGSELPATALPGGSLYQLGISLETSDGRTIAFSSLGGQPLLLTMFYSQCTSVCPLITNQLQLLDRRLAPGVRSRMRVLMVSLDPARDRRAGLRRFGEQHHITDPRWIVARADPDGVRMLAAALGVRYRQLPDGSFNHSTTIVLADIDGVVRARTSGVNSSDAELVRVANSMVAATAANPRDGVPVRPR